MCKLCSWVIQIELNIRVAIARLRLQKLLHQDDPVALGGDAAEHERNAREAEVDLP